MYFHFFSQVSRVLFPTRKAYVLRETQDFGCEYNLALLCLGCDIYLCLDLWDSFQGLEYLSCLDERNNCIIHIIVVYTYMWRHQLTNIMKSPYLSTITDANMNIYTRLIIAERKAVEMCVLFLLRWMQVGQSLESS